jgi:hypothetical protein
MGCVLPYIFTANGLDHIVWRRSQKICNDGKLIDVIFAREERLALEHLGKNTAYTPDVNLNVVLLPCEHNFRRPVVSRGNISGHLWVLDTRETEIANLKIAILVDENVTGFEVTVDDTS